MKAHALHLLSILKRANCLRDFQKGEEVGRTATVVNVGKNTKFFPLNIGNERGAVLRLSAIIWSALISFATVERNLFFLQPFIKRALPLRKICSHVSNQPNSVCEISRSGSVDETPYGVEHYTLWSRYNMKHDAICSYVEGWLSRHMPQVRRWNYDDNEGEKSVELFHVHVYIEVVPYSYQRPESVTSDVSPVSRT